MLVIDSFIVIIDPFSYHCCNFRMIGMRSLRIMIQRNLINFNLLNDMRSRIKLYMANFV
jgi:hypothetical protein